MSRTLEQELTGSIEDANKKAVYVWEKGEVAWVKTTNRIPIKVKFDGERWLSGNKWRYEKIYQYEVLEGNDYDLVGAVSWARENLFVETREEAISHFRAWETRKLSGAATEYAKNMAAIYEYEKLNP
jgi:hypothetical protein